MRGQDGAPAGIGDSVAQSSTHKLRRAFSGFYESDLFPARPAAPKDSNKGFRVLSPKPCGCRAEHPNCAARAPGIEKTTCFKFKSRR